MNIVGLGIDIISIERVRQVKNIERFIEYILIDSEIELMKNSRDPMEFLASRFSSKEALIKAYPENIHYHDIETSKNGDRFIQKVLTPGSHVYSINSSISHSFENAVAIATVSKK